MSEALLTTPAALFSVEASPLCVIAQPAGCDPAGRWGLQIAGEKQGDTTP